MGNVNIMELLSLDKNNRRNVGLVFVAFGLSLIISTLFEMDGDVDDEK